MNIQKLTGLTGLVHYKTLEDKVLFNTDAGMLNIGFWDEDIVRIRLGNAQVNTYPIIVGKPAQKKIIYSGEDGKHVVRCGAGELRLNPGRPDGEEPFEPISLTFSYNGRKVVQPSPDGHFVRRFRIPPFARTQNGWFFSVALQPGAPIYGFGEKYGSLNKRGQKLVSWAEDALGVNEEVCYKNAPFCWTPTGSHNQDGRSGYGVFIHTSARVTHGAGYPQWSNWSYAAHVEDEVLDLFFIAGDSPQDFIKRYTDITGRTTDVPLWSLGNWISRAYYKTFEEAEDVARTIRERKIPCDVYTLDGRAWLDTSTRFYFEFDAARYPEPEKFMAIMKELSMKLCVWEYPICSAEHPKFKEFDQKGWFLKDRDGNTYQYEFDLSPFGKVLTPLPKSGLLDFTVPEAAQWWYDQHIRLHKMGVDVFKVDFGEQTPEDAYASNGDSGIKFHNALPLLYNKTCFEAAEEHHGKGIIWSRSGWAGSQRFPMQWGGDPQASWNGLAGSIIGGQSWGLTGAPFYSHDIGGFYGGSPDAELYVRWLQAGVMGPFCRIHGIGPREPWYFGDEAEEIVKEWLALRYRLLPYLKRQVLEAVDSGLPVMRAMALAFPHDPLAQGFELQYMLGDHLLVAPVLQPGGFVSLYLPQGVWYDYFSGEKIQGGQVLELTLPLERIPVHVREGAVLAEGPSVQHTGELTADNRIETIRVFGMPDSHALDHEPDVRITCQADLTAIECSAVVKHEVFGAAFKKKEGRLEVFQEKD
ncbi:glycoside hydrolase family 31 protein [Desulfococcaceae bacterium HSG9]|nr:glycoside hydrolase family 31 protein [Desulfococcaceae bacterium HSG9]